MFKIETKVEDGTTGRIDTFTLEVGTRVVYKGDCCNHGGWGTIREISENRWGVRITIHEDGGDEREWTTTPSNFAGCGRRFYTEAEANAKNLGETWGRTVTAS
jgi:hypothetical protein